MQRRNFLGLIAASAGLMACGRSNAAGLPHGETFGPNYALGHRLRDGLSFPEPTSHERIPVVIVGGGIAGLSAGWKLHKSGFTDFALLEMEAEPGGNARAGRNAVSAYPWGAHYLPIPTLESRAVRELLADFNLIGGDIYGAKPEYDETTLCQAPHERVYANGLWEEGLIPRLGTSRRELAQIHEFEERMQEFKHLRGKDGRKAFALPMELSSRDPALLALDRQTMRGWLTAQGWDAPHLHAYVDYCCRDDYGCGSAETSAWAGIHYFASRDGEAANAPSDSVLTWPEGNAWLARRMAEKFSGNIRSGHFVWRMQTQKNGMTLDVFLPADNRSIRLHARHVVWASPLFSLPRVWNGCPAATRHAIASLHYAPWLVANLTLREPPHERNHACAGLAWDNVIHGSPGLGYVVATHQQMRVQPGPTVLTYYRSLPIADRRKLLDQPWQAWAKEIVADLARPHPDLLQSTENIQLWRNGHAMIRPEPGLITGAARKRLLQSHDRLHLAHADLSGFSVFEEAQYRGVAAAENILRALGVQHRTSLA